MAEIAHARAPAPDNPRRSRRYRCTSACRIPLGYDVAAGPLAGPGAFVETAIQGDFALDNADTLTAPGYAVVKADLRYSTGLTGGYTQRLSVYPALRKVFDRTHIASAQDLSNTVGGASGLQNSAAVLATTTQSIFAGAPRNIVGRKRLAF